MDRYNSNIIIYRIQIENILVKYLIAKYSYNFVGTLLKMLEVNENLRPDFIELEKIISGH